MDPFGHLESIGKRVTSSGMTWQKIRNGKIIAGWDNYNLHGILAFLATDAECASECAVARNPPEQPAQVGPCLVCAPSAILAGKLGRFVRWVRPWVVATPVRAD